LVCTKEPVLLDIDMISRNLENLKVDEGSIHEKKQRVKNWIDQVEDILDDLASQHAHILVVGWKDFKGKINLTEEDDVPLMESDSLEAVENGFLRYLAKKCGTGIPIYLCSPRTSQGIRTLSLSRVNRWMPFSSWGNSSSHLLLSRNLTVFIVQRRTC